ncbi:MAG: 4-hydroxy-tetrahydrodipicolinate reductase [Firmicutes bacterium]|nr:4-hydroxy-tetrahydrodipicolinate reductase [Bacillota bacterium]
MTDKIKVVVCGALGKMGLETVRAVQNDEDLELVGLMDLRGGSGDLALEIGLGIALPLDIDLEIMLTTARPQVMIDFTNPQSVYRNALTALSLGINCVVGTTGLSETELKQLDDLARQKGVGVAVIPNFAIGAVLMMKMAAEVARYLPDVEIIEMHHDQKIDAPSGTAIKTAEMIAAARSQVPVKKIQEIEKIPGARGGDLKGIKIHSVRLPGFIAHQEVIFGGVGQSLKIRHDSFDRVGFMPGVVMTVKKVTETQGLIYGLENLL